MHGLLVAAVCCVGAPLWVKVVALVAVAWHAHRRRPRPSPERLILASDGQCLCPEVAAESLRLGPRSRYARGWVRLVDRAGRLDLLLFEDQFDGAEWSRLSALVRRLAVDEGAGREGGD